MNIGRLVLQYSCVIVYTLQFKQSLVDHGIALIAKNLQSKRVYVIHKLRCVLHASMHLHISLTVKCYVCTSVVMYMNTCTDVQVGPVSMCSCVYVCT